MYQENITKTILFNYSKFNKINKKDVFKLLRIYKMNIYLFT